MSGNNQGGSGDADFDAFEAAGTVEVGESNLASQGGDDGKPAPRRGPPREANQTAANEDDDDQSGDDEAGDDEGGDDEGGDEKPQKTARDHQIERLKREKRELQRQLRAGGNSALEQRLAAIEGRLTSGNGNDTKTPRETPAPDPTDTEKYPLGHLDDRYIEDKLEWLADKKAAERADAVLHRQQENERNQSVQQAQEALLGKVDDLATKGSELFEDFQESVVEAGMRGDWDLTQTTFEAAHDAENGAQILYDLSQDPKEATRVAKLSQIQQLRYVLDKDAELSKSKKPRTKPQAGDPPKNLPRGANSKTSISPATDNLDDFEKAWEQDAKKGRR